MAVSTRGRLSEGAVAEGGVLLLNEPLMDQIGISRAHIEATIERSREELERRRVLYRGDGEMADVTDRLRTLGR